MRKKKKETQAEKGTVDIGDISLTPSLVPLSSPLHHKMLQEPHGKERPRASWVAPEAQAMQVFRHLALM